jgi:Zn-dependent M28 family amino/carboxypeptidase
MIYRILLGAFLALPLAGLAQQPMLESGQLLKDLRVLAADSLEGRLSGSRGSHMAQGYIETRFQQIGLKNYNNSYRHFFKLQSKNLTVDKAVNLIGYIPGKTEKAIVITAHYDHIGIRNGEVYNGADDNASGVAALLAAATYFSKNKPEHTLIFAALDSEEIGLQGANAFLENPPLPIADIVLNVNMDMLSINNTGELYASGSYHYPQLDSFAKQVKPRKHASLKLGHDRPEQGKDDWTNQSDHYQFHKRKIPYIYFGVEDHAHYHKPTDDFDKVNQAFFADAAALVIDFIVLVDKSSR